MELVLTEICEYLNNYFWQKKAKGTYTISGGSITLPWMKAGQHFRIIGSSLNDGVYQYPATQMQDETFTGEIWAMAVPQTVIALASEIKDWKAKYEKAGSMALSPFNSESFAGYSYSKSGGGSSGGSNITWQDVYGGRLNKYRRLRGAR
jgi:hypothetical protein